MRDKRRLASIATRPKLWRMIGRELHAATLKKLFPCWDESLLRKLQHLPPNLPYQKGKTKARRLTEWRAAHPSMVTMRPIRIPLKVSKVGSAVGL